MVVVNLMAVVVVMVMAVVVVVVEMVVVVMTDKASGSSYHGVTPRDERLVEVLLLMWW